MRNRIVLIMSISWILCSCKTEPDLVLRQKPGENFTFYTSRELYNQAMGERITDTGNAFIIKSAESMRDDPSKGGHDLLKITVSHPRSCDGKFEFIWDGAIMESYPEQINIFLRLPGSCPDDDQITETVLHLDLDEFIGQPDLVDRAVFHIVNGSVSSGDEDMSVSFS
ncbi:MAG TPA: hypothetical protein VIQ51_04155 [Chryseosolibacter sp.]|jgi:hypothetical protein